MHILIREEQPQDFKAAETVAREAFWNLYVPGCNEHYLLHTMRNHHDFITELSMVAVLDQQIVGQIAYTKSLLSCDGEPQLDSITFGPLSILPAYQGKGIGTRLVQQSLQKAQRLGHSVVVISGYPQHYCKYGFRSGKDLGVSDADGRYPYSLLALELASGALKGKQWRYSESAAYSTDDNEVAVYDRLFDPKQPEYRPSQDVFSITIRAYVE